MWRGAVDPALWVSRPAFGHAGGPFEIVLTDAGRLRAWAVGAQVRQGAPAKALAELHALGGEVLYTARGGYRLSPGPFAREHDHLTLSYLRSLGYIEIESHSGGESLRLTAQGRAACARSIAETESLLARVRASEAAQ
jgi:hypothetical protein